MKKNRLNKAFSLIEISIVILIVGILISGVSLGVDLYQDFRLASARSLTQNSRVGRINDLVLWLEASKNLVLSLMILLTAPQSPNGKILPQIY